MFAFSGAKENVAVDVTACMGIPPGEEAATRPVFR
jgi:hypothetical protein